MFKICMRFSFLFLLFIKINASELAQEECLRDPSSIKSLHEKMLTAMARNYENSKWKESFERDTAARERYEEKVKEGTACVYTEWLLTDSLLEELKTKALELKASIPDGSFLIQVGRSPWLLQEMTKALGLDVHWITLPFSHKIGFARTEYDLINCTNHTPWEIEDLPEPQKSWVISYISFLQDKLNITNEKLTPFAGRIYIIDYISSGECLQDALELVNKAIGIDLGITKIGFSDYGDSPHWSDNPKNMFFSISESLGLNMIAKHTLTTDEAKRHNVTEFDPDSFFENAHGPTFYPAEWTDPIALARVSKPAPLTLTAAAKREQIIDFASYRSDKK